MKRRAAIDTGGGRATGETDLQVARQLISKAGVLPVLTPLLETGVGRPRTLPLEAFVVAAQLNALQRHHQGHLVEIARILNAMTPDQHASLGIREWDPAEALRPGRAAFRQPLQDSRGGAGGGRHQG